MKRRSLLLAFIAAFLVSQPTTFGMQSAVIINTLNESSDSETALISRPTMWVSNIVNYSIYTTKTDPQPLHYFDPHQFELCMDAEHTSLSQDTMANLYQHIHAKIGQQPYMAEWTRAQEQLIVNREFAREYLKKNHTNPGSINPEIINQLKKVCTAVIAFLFQNEEQQAEALHSANHRWGTCKLTNCPADWNWTLTRLPADQALDKLYEIDEATRLIQLDNSIAHPHVKRSSAMIGSTSK